MASIPDNTLSPAHLLTLGMFVFGMDSAGYNQLERRMTWRHANTERHMARAASQFTGPGEDSITLSGMIVPEVAGSYSSINRLIEMADTGDNWPLINGAGVVFGRFRITGLDQTHRHVMAGGLPRALDFTLTLERAD